MQDYLEDLRSFVAKRLEIDGEVVDFQLEVPPRPEMGDYALPAFPLAKILRKAPQQIAADFAATWAEDEELPSFIRRVEALGPYVNFFLDPVRYTTDVLSDILEKGESYGAGEGLSDQTVLVEYSSPNIAKPFHVGHAFSTLIGASIARIYDFLGYDVQRLNHLGDYGTQFGKLIVAYRMWGDGEALKADPIPELLRVYVKFHEEAEENESLEDEARRAFVRLEQGEEEETALWKDFRDLSIESFNKVYDRLGVTFDSWKGESYYSDKMGAVIELLNEKGILEDSEGAKVVRLDDENLPPCIVVKSDGSSIYATRDLAAAIYRWNTYEFARNIYVVGNPQALHFQQVFAVLKRAGFDFADRCKHVGFGLVKFPDRVIATRTGDVVHLSDLLEQSVAKAREIIEANAETRGDVFSETELDEVSEKVGIGAVVYLFHKSGRERDIIFRWEDMLDFDGDTGPYLQYTYARCNSMLRKAEEQGLEKMKAEDLAYERLVEDDVLPLLKLLAKFPEAVKEAAETYEPFMIGRQVSEIAREFNRYYNAYPILRDEDPARRAAKLALCRAVLTVMGIGLNLIGIQPTERI